MRILLITFFLIVLTTVKGQSVNVKLYNPATNAEKDITDAVKKAKAANKRVFVQAGGNWCSWCIEFNRFCKSDRQVDSILKANYIVYHLNYSPENKNENLLAKFGYPQRFGFPVFLILDANGNRIHTQNSSYLEQGRSYNKQKVMEFLEHWNTKATEPLIYKNF